MTSPLEITEKLKNGKGIDRREKVMADINLRTSEPSPNSSLHAHNEIRIVFLSEIPITRTINNTKSEGTNNSSHIRSSSNLLNGTIYHQNRTLGVDTLADSDGSPLRGKVLTILREKGASVPHSTIKNGFPVASGYYNANATLHFRIEDSATCVTSVWDNLFIYKRIAAVVTVVSGPNPKAKQQLGALKTLFDQEEYASIIRRCIVFEGTDEQMAPLNKSIFKSVGIATAPLEKIVHCLLLDLASEIVQSFAHRVASMSNTMTSEGVLTPMDAIAYEGPSGLMVHKDLPTKVIMGRIAKQQGDLLLQLGATNAAIKAFYQAVNLDSLWVAATLESIAATRYLVNESLFNRRKLRKEQLLKLRKKYTKLAKNKEETNKLDLSLLVTIEEEAQNAQTRINKVLSSSSAGIGSNGIVSSSKDGPIPSNIRQKIRKEVEEPLIGAVKKLKKYIKKIQCIVVNEQLNSDDEKDLKDNDKQVIMTDIVFSSIGEVIVYYDRTVALCLYELELYLSHAYFTYPGPRAAGNINPKSGILDSTQKMSNYFLSGANSSGGYEFLGAIGSSSTLAQISPKLSSDKNNIAIFIGIEIELLMKLAQIRAEQHRIKALMQSIKSLHDACNFMYTISSTKALAILRKIPFFCYDCGCIRKAIYYLQQVAEKEKTEGFVLNALQSLLTACQWCGLPLAVDRLHGGICLQQNFEAGQSNPQSKRDHHDRHYRNTEEYKINHEEDNCCSSSGESDEEIRDNNSGHTSGGGHTSANVNGSAAVRIQVALLFEMLVVLRSVQDRDERQWGMASHIATLLLFKFPSFISDENLQKLLFILESCSASLPSHLQPTIVPPPLFKKAEPIPLPSHLAPQKMHVGGVRFITFTNKMEQVCFNGAIIRTPVANMWVVGEVANVELEVVNPLPSLLMLSSVALVCHMKEDASVKGITCDTSPKTSNIHENVECSLRTAHRFSVTNRGDISAACCYVTKGIELSPQGQDTVTTHIMPEREGILVIDGIEVRIGQFEFKMPIGIPMETPIEIPVVERLPLIHCAFSADETELFAKQEHSFSVTVENIGDITIDKMTVTIHKGTCVFMDCNGSCVHVKPEDIINQRKWRSSIREEGEKARKQEDAFNKTMGTKIGTGLGKYHVAGNTPCSPNSRRRDVIHSLPNARLSHPEQIRVIVEGNLFSYDNIYNAPNKNGTNHINTASGETAVNTSQTVPSVDGNPLFALPLKPNSRRDLKVTVLPPSHVKTLREEYLIARVRYSGKFEQPKVPDTLDPTTPTFAPIPQRIHETRHRIFLIPSLEVRETFLMPDRRYVIAKVMNLCESCSLAITPHPLFPFERQTDAIILPKQEAALRFTIAHIPEYLHKFNLEWHVQDRPDVNGILEIDFTKALENVRCTEPLEEVVITGTVLTSLRPHGVPLVQDENTDCNSLDVSGTVYPPLSKDIMGYVWKSSNTLQYHRNSIDPANCSSSSTNTQFYNEASNDGDCDNSAISSIIFPVGHSIEIRMDVYAPWIRAVPATITFMFSPDDDGAMLAGPFSTKCTLGVGCPPFSEIVEAFLFAPGEHTLWVIVRDIEGREIQHRWTLRAEHAIIG